jgi:hypothetical protein
MLWLVREGDSYVKAGHCYMNHMSFCRLVIIVFKIPSQTGNLHEGFTITLNINGPSALQGRYRHFTANLQFRSCSSQMVFSFLTAHGL